MELRGRKRGSNNGICPCGEPALLQGIGLSKRDNKPYFFKYCKDCTKLKYLSKYKVASDVKPVAEKPRRQNHFYRVVSQHKAGKCQSCGWKPPLRAALDLDHIIPRSKGGSDDPTNLQTLCPNCHRLKTLRDRGLL
jgi:5-methylcytosine-specific restriction endonuclease McrA